MSERVTILAIICATVLGILIGFTQFKLRNQPPQPMKFQEFCRVHLPMYVFKGQDVGVPVRIGNNILLIQSIENGDAVLDKTCEL